ncbi:Ig-like domain-containing protein [Pantoea sp. X85]|uniref:Ig-like domain-containing protein n=1 Tax=Pantoea sp. X85 TaxID=3037258 RepID=UPI002412F48E|nr:Ig-like domain-containing protein [Pantoea sp. X85]WFL66109.1 Ig-like domain-containing protein [Pantoea sp. X85]
MNDLLARSPVFYRESADGRLVFGNKTALEPGGFIELVIGTDTFRVPVDDKGFYRWEAATPYADGEYSFSIRHFDAAGNRSTPTLGTVIVDTTPPAAPDLINLYDDQGAVTGSFDAGKATDDKRPTLTGIAQKGSTVYLLNDKNEKIGSAVADKVTGKWVIEPSQDLKDGVNSLRLMAEETFGGKLRAGTPSQAFDIVIAGDDVKVTITDALDDAGSFTGSLGHGALTDDATPTLRGEVSAGSTVIVYYRLAGSPTWAGSATATVSGDSWSWTPGSNLPDGRYEFQASTGEVASVLFELEIAGTAGIAQRTRIESVTDDFGPVTGQLANGAMTDDATPTFQGRAEANSQVVIRYTLAGGAAASVTVNADSTGHWNWTPGVSLATGQWTFDVKSQGQSGWNDSFTLTINPDADRNATIDSALDDFGPVTGSLSSGSSTDDTTPTLRGSGPANGAITLRYKLGSGEYASTTVNVDNSGHWTWTPSALAKGSWTFEVQKAGQSGWSSFTLTVDPALDLKPSIDGAWDDFGAVTGSLKSGDATDDSTPTLRGKGVAGSVIYFQSGTSGGAWYDAGSTVVKADGSWEWTSPALSRNGTWEFRAKASHGGVDSTWTGKFILKYTAAEAPAITDALDNAGPVTGSLSSGSSTDDTTPTLRGSGPANSTITLHYKTDGGSYASTTVNVDSTGHWTWTPSALAKGSWTFEVQNAGESGWNSFTLTIDPDLDRYPTIDSAWDDAGPSTGSLSSGSSTDDTTPTLRGSGPANSVITLRYKLGNGGYTSITVNVDSSGHWTWTPSALAKGSWTFEVQKTGQSDWSSFTLTVDPTLDRNATINGAYDDFGTVKGIIANGGITDDATPTLNGSGPANSVISLRYKLGSGGYASTTVNVDAAGNWTWTPSALASGKWTFEVQKPGQSGWSSFTLTIDPTVDRKPTIDSAWDDVGPTTGLISNGGTTDDSTPTLRGSGPANSTILLRYFRLATLFDGTIKVDASGNWTWTAPQLEDGNWTFEVKKEGQHEWSSYELNIDSSADRYPTIDSAWDDAGPNTGSLSSGSSTDDATPTLRGSGPANSTITLRYKLDGGSYASTTVNVDSAGKWTWTPSALAKGSWTFEVQKAGQSGWSSFTLTVDPALDLKPTIDGAWDDFGAVTGSLKSGDITDDSTPTLRGRGVAGSVIYFQSGTWDGAWENAGSTVVKADGSWEWTSPALSHNTTWEFRALARLDGAESDWSGKFVLEYNNPAPTITDAFDDFGAETGSLASGDTTDDQTPTLRGTAPADSVVMIRAQHASGETTYSVQADADGKWSWTPDKGLAKGDWDFQVKQSEAENWEESFELNITKDYSGVWGILDFENLPKSNFRHGSMLTFNENSKITFSDGDTKNYFAHIVNTPDDAPNGWGDQCLYFSGKGELIAWLEKPSWKSGKISELGFSIWNSSSQDTTFTVYYGQGINNDGAFDVIVKAGESFSFDSADYLGTSTLYRFIMLEINNYHDGIYFDNIFTVEHPMPISLMDSDEPENIVHFLNGIDQLTDHPITGSETQVDTLQLTGKDQLLDLSQHQAEIHSVEIFDIRSSGDNTLKIDLDALLHYGEKDLFIEDGKTQLMVNGDAGDVVQLKDILPEGSDISEWQHQQGTVTVAGVEYEVYSHGDDAELLVQQGVKTELI